MATPGNILQGHFDWYYIAFTGTGSTPISSNTVGWTSWTQGGYLNPDGVKLTDQVEFLHADTDDVRGPVKSNIINEGALFSFSALESDLAAMGIAMAHASYTEGAVPGTDSNTLTVGGLANASLSYYSVGFEGVGSTGLAEVWVAYKCLAVGPLELQMQRNAWRSLPFTFMAYLVTGRSAGDQLYGATEITSA